MWQVFLFEYPSPIALQGLLKCQWYSLVTGVDSVFAAAVRVCKTVK
jgi:hypothetical protein